MTYGSDQHGKATFTLTAEEHEAFKSGKPVVKEVGDASGMATITLKMTRPRSKTDRFPEQVYGEHK